MTKPIKCPGCDNIIGTYTNFNRDIDHIQSVMEDHIDVCLPSQRIQRGLVNDTVNRLGGAR